MAARLWYNVAMKKIAIVGFGFMGRMHYGCWKKLRGAKVVAICDSNLAQLEKASGDVRLNCKDTIVAQLAENVGIKVTFNRTLSFEPDGMFFLSVTFGVMMRFSPVYMSEIEWKSVDLAGEFKAHCPALLANLMSRTSLLVAEITSASGQMPIVTPGGVTPTPGAKR